MFWDKSIVRYQILDCLIIQVNIFKTRAWEMRVCMKQNLGKKHKKWNFEPAIKKTAAGEKGGEEIKWKKKIKRQNRLCL